MPSVISSTAMLLDLLVQNNVFFPYVAVSDDGQWEEAVRIYSSTPLEELHDLIGLALAYFRIGRMPESVQGEQSLPFHDC